MSHQWVQLEWVDGRRIGVVTITRARALNALNPQVLRDLEHQIDTIEAENAARVAIITGEGSKAFVAGADIGVIHDVPDANAAQEFAERGQRLFQRVAQSPVIFLGAINGYALGGGMELALALDIRIASKTARLGQPEINLGIIPGFGGTQRLARLVGEGRALWLIASGDPVTAAEAETMGLVDEVVDPDALMDACLHRARVLADKAPLALRDAKRLVRGSRDWSLPDGLEEEARSFARLAVSEDGREGTQAFLEKRTPEFRGR